MPLLGAAACYAVGGWFIDARRINCEFDAANPDKPCYDLCEAVGGSDFKLPVPLTNLDPAKMEDCSIAAVRWLQIMGALTGLCHGVHFHYGKHYLLSFSRFERRLLVQVRGGVLGVLSAAFMVTAAAMATLFILEQAMVAWNGGADGAGGWWKQDWWTSCARRAVVAGGGYYALRTISWLAGKEAVGPIGPVPRVPMPLVRAARAQPRRAAIEPAFR
eukprot:SAG22_NODE_476_length_9995_cov_9.488480_6_plen_217_part_00